MTGAIVNLQDHEDRARAVLDESAWAYFSGGAADETTLRRNHEAWGELGLAPRVLQDLRGGHTRIELLGRTWPVPLLVAPMAHQRWAHEDGEGSMALAAAAQGCGMVLSHQTSTGLEVVSGLVRNEPGRGPLWFQLYWLPDRGELLSLIRQVEAAGYEALVLTVDAPVTGVRDRERRHPLQLPAGVRPVHWKGVAPAEGEAFCGGLAAVAPTWDDIAWLRGQTRLPLLLKGITHPADARQAAKLGVQGVIVSNHGGRTLDTMPSTAELLPRVADALKGANEQQALLVDGGIRRGTDLFKALALGADAALVGRPCLWGLSHAGARGVAHVLRLLRDEFEMAMALCGCREPAGISGDYLHKP